MIKKRIFVFLGLSSMSLSFLAGCGAKYYTIQFVNYDGTLLEKYVDVEKGAEVSYQGNKPVRYDDSKNYYVYAGWDQEVTVAKKNVTYTATYTAYPITEVAETPDSYVDTLPSATADGTILHAFGWKYSDVESQLPYIARAGYKSVQLLPVQVPKSSGASWWAYYQPLAFRIADGEESPLGDKAALAQLCTKAEEYNISIIVDIVFNHMANISDKDLEEDKTPKVSPTVADYESYIYEHRNDAENPTFHHNPNAEGSGAETQVYPYGGLPDLNTANTYVQGRALDLLKECIDVGIDGFRFDAAKHIESPEDPQYPSDFWPNVLGAAKEYYKGKTGKDLYAYGETLGSPKGRSIDCYTKYMNVTEGGYGSTLLSGISARSASKVINAKYGLSTNESNMVTWLESHDSYLGDKNPWSNEFMARGWAALNSRKNTRSLYLARPERTSLFGDQYEISMATIYDYFFRDESIGVINRFHNRFFGADEYQGADGSIYYVERVKDNDKGAVVVDFAGSSKVVVDFAKLATGVYYDQLTGKSVTVRNGHATIELDKSGIAVLTMSKNKAHPTFTIDEHGGLFAGEKEVTVEYKNAETATYQINGGTPVAFNSGDKIKFAATQASEGKVKLTINVSNSQYTESETFTYTPITLIEGYFNVVNVKSSRLSNPNLYMWIWDGNGNDYWSQEYTSSGNVLLVANSVLTGKQGFKFVIFKEGHVIEDIHKWSSAETSAALMESPNIEGKVLEQGYYDGTNL